ncbi:hypothetical protein [Brucella sp. 191011898]|uniref:hypothetical protein n=1 Tax=Brucella sp. 191011898 TaxID=2730447 RepID=UPI0015DE3F44|nr:hypothetical protein [Brucella sp. 191011898]CAB4326605.1 hypothetical protein BCH_01951 [Brucella sp. 191011898]
MAYQDQFYTAGTVTVTNGSATVTGTGTGWETALIVGGVFYAGGGAYPIQSVSGETELTLAIPYVGVDAAGVDYAIDRQRAAAISNIAMNDRLAQIIREISIGNVENLNALESVNNLIAFAELTLAANKILNTDASGNLTQSDITALGRSFLVLTGTNGNIPVMTGGDGVASRPIVGPVSQSGGIPNGALFETGSNANGQYFRTADGFQICIHRLSGVTIPSGSPGNVNLSWTYPAAFSELLYVDLRHVAANVYVTSSNTDYADTSAANWYIFNNFASSVTATVYFLSVGRWL